MHARRSRRIHAVTIAVLTGVLLASLGGPASAGGGPRAVRVARGLNGPAAFTFLPKGTIVYLERGTGRVRFLNPKTDADRVWFRIRGVNGQGERGALGVALHPQWPQRKLLYAYVTRRVDGKLRNQIVRIRDRDGHGARLRVLLSTPANATSPYHNGGRILFGPDGLLYGVVGDGHRPRSAQDLSKNLRGKIVRIEPDGSRPPTNPMIGGRRMKAYAFGIRNSFGFAFDPQTGDLWETENGPGCNDEINRILPGDNYAWGPNENCPNTNQDGPAPRRLPLVNFANPIGITGAAFCDGCALGAAREGDLYFGNVNSGTLRRVTLNAQRDDVAGGVVIVLQAPRGSILSMEAAPNGRIYFSDFRAIYRLKQPA